MQKCQYACLGNAPELFLAEPENCPRENGFCVLSNGGDQNSGVIKINSIDGNTDSAQAECLKRCRARSDATGCEVIWNQSNRGCYIHTSTVAKGNNANNHYCWVFSKCRKGKHHDTNLIF